jgi:hypothetical protein
MIEKRVGKKGKKEGETVYSIKEGHLVFLYDERSWDFRAKSL